MEGQEGKYNIKVASKMVGIRPGTLRAWERRYKMIAPVRNELGYRLYTEEHIKILKWLNAKVNQGFTIGQAVAQLGNRRIGIQEEKLQEENQLSIYGTQLLTPLLEFNEVRGLEIINTLFSLFTLEKVVYEVLPESLEKLSDLKLAGEITSAQQNFAASIIGSKMKMVFHSLSRYSSFPKAIAVCSPGENEETDLLLLSVFLRLKGFDVIYIGPGISERELDQAVKTIGPKFLFLSCSFQENITLVLSIGTQFTLNYKNLKVGISGKAVKAMKKAEREPFSSFIMGQTISEWEKWLPNVIE